MKKKIGLFLISVLFIINFTILNTYADYVTDIISFDLSVGARSSSSSSSVAPSQDTAFALVDITHHSGKAEYDAVYQTRYGSSWVAIGRIDDNSSEEYLQFHPELGTYGGGTKLKQCKGSNTTDTYCMLKGHQYRMYFVNDNWFYKFTFYGNFKGLH